MAEVSAKPPEDGPSAAPAGSQAGEVSPEETIARSASGAAATSLVGLLARGAGLFTTLVVTYFVSRAELGNANLAMIVVTIFHTATLLTPQQALLTRHDHFDEALALVRFFAAWSGLLVVGLILLSGRAILAALGQPEATPILWVYCAAMLLERLAVIPALQLNYQLRFLALARLDLYANLAYVVVTISSAVGGFGGMSLAFGMVARHGTRLLMLLGLIGASQVWPGRPRWGQLERRLAREVLHYSLPVHLGGFGEFLTLYMDNVLVGKLYGAAAQGLYVVGFTLAMTPCDTIALQGAVAMNRALGLRDAATRRDTYLKGLRYMSLVLFPIAGLTALSAGTLQQALLPPKWREVAPIAVALVIGAASMGVRRLAFAHLTAIHKPRPAALIEAVRLLLFGALLMGVVTLDRTRTHIAWVGWGVSAASALAAVISLVVSLRSDGMRIGDGLRALLPPALGTMVMGALLLGLQRGLDMGHLSPSLGRLLCEVCAGAAVYVLYLRLCHGDIYREASGWLRGLRKKGSG